MLKEFPTLQGMATFTSNVDYFEPLYRAGRFVQSGVSWAVPTHIVWQREMWNASASYVRPSLKTDDNPAATNLFVYWNANPVGSNESVVVAHSSSGATPPSGSTAGSPTGPDTQAFPLSANFSDGSTFAFDRRERPHIIFDGHKPVTLTTGVVAPEDDATKVARWPDASFTFLQPIGPGDEEGEVGLVGHFLAAPVVMKTDDDGNRTDAVIAAVPPTIQLDGAALVHQRLAFQHGSPHVVKAVAHLKLVADVQLLTGPFTVTNKSEPPILPPTGSVHDYLSTSSYWWPCTDTCTPATLKALKIATCSKWCAPWNNQCNWTAASDPGTPALYPCNKTTGSPWVSHSGYGNPAGSKLNRQQADGVWHAVYPLTLYWWYTQEPKYLARAAKIMRVYFLDGATKMNPNLNFAQGEPGVWDGAAGGTVDFDRLRWAIDGMLRPIQLRPSCETMSRLPFRA
jgi:hypothetical protein